MTARRITYAGVAGVTTPFALVVDQFLWTRLPLYFGPSVVIAFLAPWFVGGIGMVVGW